MGLQKYRAKRDFKKTREPGAVLSKDKKSRFVVQKHHASHLHYDFRLEMDGVLKSWAVPKGPTLDPKIKRLAVEVEDHPVSYRDFEGEIPKGEYGGGVVIVWDRGTWAPVVGDPSKALKAGRLEFELKGEKLNGKFILVRTRGSGKSWLLIKRTDKFAKAGSSDSLLSERDESVIIGKTIDDLEAKNQKSQPRKIPGKKAAPRKSADPMPAFFEPQFASLREDIPPGDQWLHEIKLDGYRTQCRIENGKTQLLTRSGLDWTKKYGDLGLECAKLKARSAVLDGEVVSLDEQGRSRFSLLQKAIKQQTTDGLIYFVFDLLYLDGKDLTALPLLQRKQILRDLLESSPKIKRVLFSEHWQVSGKELLRKSCALDLEGVVSKKADASYEPGRGDGWTKVKCGHDQEFVIVGATEGKGARSGFGALLLGAYDESGKLNYVGRVGTGFDSAMLKSISKKMERLKTDDSPIDENVPGARSVQWVKPKLVAQIKFAEWTADGKLRHATFEGLREDKPAIATLMDRPPHRDVKLSKAIPRLAKAPKAKKTAEAPKITHGDRVMFADDQITKSDLSEYYASVSKLLLPHISNRPLSLVRCPDGVGKFCFFQKHATDLGHQLIKSAAVAVDHKGKKYENVMYIDSADGLQSLSQMGSIELHAWGSHLPKIENPDLMIFDLDPGERVGWNQMIDGALAIREMLQGIRLESFVKVSGGKGLHVHVPIAPNYDWEQIKAFTKTVATALAKREPTLYTASISKEKRAGRIFIDYLRNGYGATAVAPYSVRARAHAPVALPIAWRELKGDLEPDQFRVKDLTKRLLSKKGVSDPWSGYFKMKQKVSILEALKEKRA